MLYDNRRRASIMRAIMRSAFAVSAIVVMLSFVDTESFLHEYRWLVTAAAVAVLASCFVGGLDEVSIQLDNEYVEISSQPIIMPKGQTHTWSIEGKRLKRYRYINLLIAHYLYIDYTGHHGNERHLRTGLTLVDGKARKRLISSLKEMLRQNSN